MSAQPLKGVEVLEIGQFVAAPYAGMVLADLGASVTKIEPPDGDGVRGWGPHPGGESAPFMAYNRGKRGIAVDIRMPEGREIVLRTYDRVDVVIENNRPGVLANCRLDAEVARARNARLIFCSITGFGRNVPGAERPAFDLILQGLTGLMSITGGKYGAPAKVPVPIADGTAALHATTAILAALHERQRTSEGATIDISLQASTMTWMMLVGAAYFGGGGEPAKLGSAHPLAAPYQAFRAADGYLTIAAGNERQWQRLCLVLGLEALRDDPRFARNSDRAINQEALLRLIEKRLATRPCVDWIERLSSAGVPCGPVHGLPAALEDEALRARGMLGSFEHPQAGHTRTIGDPIVLSGPRPPLRRSPLLGEHTREILGELGFDAAAIELMRQSRAILCGQDDRADAGASKAASSL